MNPYDSINEFDKYIAFAEGEESERKRICKKLIDEGYFETNTEFYGALLNEPKKDCHEDNA